MERGAGAGGVGLGGAGDGSGGARGAGGAGGEVCAHDQSGPSEESQLFVLAAEKLSI